MTIIPMPIPVSSAGSTPLPPEGGVVLGIAILLLSTVMWSLFVVAVNELRRNFDGLGAVVTWFVFLLAVGATLGGLALVIPSVMALVR